MIAPDPMTDDELDARQRSSLLAVRRRKRAATAATRRGATAASGPRVPPDGEATLIDGRDDLELSLWAAIAAGLRQERERRRA